MRTNNNPSRPKIDLNDSLEIKCECGGTTFLPAVKLRKISKLLAGTPKDAIIPIECYLCGECGELLIELLPEEVKHLYDTEK